jgi:hypothetical protein
MTYRSPNTFLCVVRAFARRTILATRSDAGAGPSGAGASVRARRLSW